MARNFREFAPGLADVTPTPNYCEAIFWEQRQNTAQNRSAIYGSSCGRWWFPKFGAQGHGSKECDHQDPSELQVNMWSAGGSSWGSCCCMDGAPSGGGAYMKACFEPKPGYYCYVVAHGGCCQPTTTDARCYSFWKHGNECAEMCINGGWCGFSQCYFFSCCNNRDCGALDWDGTMRDKTRYQYGCGCSQFFNGDPCAKYAPTMVGRRPWDRSRTNKDGWNHVPGTGSGKKQSQFACKEATTHLKSCLGDCRGAAPECTMNYANIQKGYHVGFVAVENCGKQAWHSCGGKKYGQSGSGTRTSGPRWINFTSVNADAWGGWNWSQWHLCHNGSNNNNCYSNVRVVGHSGNAARVCGGPCCCSGWPGHGMVMLRYR